MEISFSTLSFTDLKRLVLFVAQSFIFHDYTFWRFFVYFQNENSPDLTFSEEVYFPQKIKTTDGHYTLPWSRVVNCNEFKYNCMLKIYRMGLQFAQIIYLCCCVITLMHFIQQHYVIYYLDLGLDDNCCLHYARFHSCLLLNARCKCIINQSLLIIALYENKKRAQWRNAKNNHVDIKW